MGLIVQKFGGTSVGSVERIKSVAAHALDTQAKGHQVILVVSAMSGETNRLVELAHQINPIPFSREYDLLIASGEQIAVGLVSLAINTEAARRGLFGPRSRGFLGYQLGILTDQVYSKARIQSIRTDLLRSELANQVIPVVAGFQGVDADNNITTLGRGGSDTSAVAIAAAIQATECEIYTDVDGVYTTDPRLCPKAKKIDFISYEEMMELAGLGAKVLQIRSVELAAKFSVDVHVRSSFTKVEGTHVISQEKMKNMKGFEDVVVAGVASEAAQIKFTIQNVHDKPGLAAKIFGALADASVVVDVIVQDVPSNGMLTISFTVGKSDAATAHKVLDGLKVDYPGDIGSSMRIIEEQGLAKVSVVGVGMQHHPGVASKMFQLLAERHINIKLITTSEIKISCMIDEAQMKDAVNALHDGFALER